MDLHEAYIEINKVKWAIGIKVEYCQCGIAFSYDLEGQPFCRICNANVHYALTEGG